MRLFRGLFFGLLMTAAAVLVLVIASDVAGTKAAVWFGLGAAAGGCLIVYLTREDA